MSVSSFSSLTTTTTNSNNNVPQTNNVKTRESIRTEASTLGSKGRKNRLEISIQLRHNKRSRAISQKRKSSNKKEETKSNINKQKENTHPKESLQKILILKDSTLVDNEINKLKNSDITLGEPEGKLIVQILNHVFSPTNQTNNNNMYTQHFRTELLSLLVDLLSIDDNHQTATHCLNAKILDSVAIALASSFTQTLPIQTTTTTTQSVQTKTNNNTTTTITTVDQEKERNYLIWILCNIVGDGDAARMEFITHKADFLKVLIEMCTPNYLMRNSHTVNTIERVAWLFRLLCSFNKSPNKKMIESKDTLKLMEVWQKIIPVMSDLLCWKDEKAEPTIEEICNGFCDLFEFMKLHTDIEKFVLQLFSKHHVSLRILELLAHNNNNMEDGMNVLALLSCPTTIPCEAIPMLCKFLTFKTNEINAINTETLENVCFVLANLAAEPDPKFIQAIVVHGLSAIKNLICDEKQPTKVRIEAAQIINNLLLFEAKIMGTVLYEKEPLLIIGLCSLLETLHKTDISSDILLMILSILEMFLQTFNLTHQKNKIVSVMEESESVDVIDQLQYIENETIQDKSSHILKTYFEDDEDDDDDDEDDDDDDEQDNNLFKN